MCSTQSLKDVLGIVYTVLSTWFGEDLLNEKLYYTDLAKDVLLSFREHNK